MFYSQFITKRSREGREEEGKEEEEGNDENRAENAEPPTLTRDLRKYIPNTSL